MPCMHQESNKLIIFSPAPHPMLQARSLFRMCCFPSRWRIFCMNPRTPNNVALLKLSRCKRRSKFWTRGISNLTKKTCLLEPLMNSRHQRMVGIRKSRVMVHLLPPFLSCFSSFPLCKTSIFMFNIVWGRGVHGTDEMKMMKFETKNWIEKRSAYCF